MRKEDDQMCLRVLYTKNKKTWYYANQINSYYIHNNYHKKHSEPVIVHTESLSSPNTLSKFINCFNLLKEIAW